MKKLGLHILTSIVTVWAGFILGSNHEQRKIESQGYFPIEILQRTNAYYSSEIEKIREACFNQLQERR